jgi:hypothetical protein
MHHPSVKRRRDTRRRRPHRPRSTCRPNCIACLPPRQTAAIRCSSISFTSEPAIRCARPVTKRCASSASVARQVSMGARGASASNCAGTCACARPRAPAAKARGSRFGMSGFGSASPFGQRLAEARSAMACATGSRSNPFLAREPVLQRRGQGGRAAFGIAGLESTCRCVTPQSGWRVRWHRRWHWVSRRESDGTVPVRPRQQHGNLRIGVGFVPHLARKNRAVVLVTGDADVRFAYTTCGVAPRR